MNIISNTMPAINPDTLPNAVSSPVTAANEAELSEVRRIEECCEDISKNRPLTPATDEYVPEKKQPPTGRYWIEKDADGKSHIYFDNPTHSEDTPDETLKSDKPEEKEKTGSSKSSSCTGNTDKIDREIEKLKKEQAKLTQQLNSETDEEKIKELEKKLSQVESELRRKDNDTYRRQHSEYSFS